MNEKTVGLLMEVSGFLKMIKLKRLTADQSASEASDLLEKIGEAMDESDE